VDDESKYRFSPLVTVDAVMVSAVVVALPTTDFTSRYFPDDVTGNRLLPTVELKEMGI
jgi:hypothetical protein